MKLTNKFNLPQTFVNVVQRPTYSKGKVDISVTQLINSPKIVALTKKFQDELEEDVADMVWSIFGSAVHKVLEHGKDPHHVIEERIFTQVDGWKISGAVDLQIMNDDGTVSISDYKTTSAYAVMQDKLEWEYQLNIYAFLVERVKNIQVRDISIVAIIRDWSRRDASTREGYPEAPIKEIPIRLWPMEEREAFVKDRVAKHSACDFALETGEALPLCTPQEMWERPTVYAVKKKGNVRAKSLHDTKEQAEAVAVSIGKDYEVEVRPGERVRCANFCPVKDHCGQWLDYQNSLTETKE